MIVRQKIAVIMALLSTLAVLMACNGTQEFIVGEGKCAVPRNLSELDRKTVKKFAAEVGKIQGLAEGGKASVEITSKLDENFPGAEDVNRIYALTYAACVGCKLAPEDKKSCVENFKRIIFAETNIREESTELEEAKKYYSTVMQTLED